MYLRRLKDLRIDKIYIKNRLRIILKLQGNSMAYMRLGKEIYQLTGFAS